MERMEIVKGILLVLHLLGFGAVFGSALVHLMTVKKNPVKLPNGILHGALLLLITGLALVGMTYAVGSEPNNLKIGIKLAVLIVLFVVVILGRRKPQATAGLLGSILGLAVLNVGIAVLWH